VHTHCCDSVECLFSAAESSLRIKVCFNVEHGHIQLGSWSLFVVIIKTSEDGIDVTFKLIVSGDHPQLTLEVLIASGLILVQAGAKNAGVLALD
jgi:hypothetical protein